MKMNKLLFMIAIILFGTGTYTYTQADNIDFSLEDFLETNENEVTPYILENGGMSFAFCPSEYCEELLYTQLASATESIHCAFFELDLESLQDIIDEKAEQIDVKIVTDNGYLYEFNRSFVKTDTWGLMHNKFCIIDDQIVTTGSMNPTLNGAYKNNNNLIVIDSAALSENYEAEFQEMWNGTFKKGDKVKNERFKLVGNDENITIENYFCPDDKCANKIIDIIAKANKSIDFMTFSFTHERIANKMLQRKLEGVKIRGVYEARQVTKYSTFKLLDYQEAEVYRDANKQNMHHKVFIIDEKIVITGSMNPSAGGDTRNDENVLIIYSEDIGKLYMEEFEKMFDAAKAKANS